MDANLIGLLVIAVTFMLGLLVGRLTARFTVSLVRDEPPDFISHERLIQLRRM